MLNRLANEWTRPLASIDLVTTQGNLPAERPLQLREFAKNSYNWCVFNH
jgi:hypothetical protein